MLIQNATRERVEAIHEIYGHHVESGSATFDERPPTLDARMQWFARFGQTGRHQLLVAVEDDAVQGYACSQPYRDHPAFDRTVELSVYLHPRSVGRGVGGALYDELIGRLRSEDVVSVLAGVAVPNPASEALHRSRGFREVGTFHNYAQKRGQTLSSTWFQLELRPPEAGGRGRPAK